MNEKKLVLITLGFLFTFPVIFCKSIPFKVFQKEEKNINVEINTKLELFLIMAYLDGRNNQYLNDFDFVYKKDIDRHFAPYKQDKNVVYINNVLHNYHAHLTIIQFLFDPEFRKNKHFYNFLDMGALGMEHSPDSWSITLENLNNAVEEFAIRSDFEDFVSSHKEYYIQKVNEVADAVSELNMVDDFYNFWGFKKDHHSIVISMLESDIHAAWFDDEQGSRGIYFLAPKFVMHNDAVFGNSEYTNIMEGKMTAKDYIYYGATHEMGHPVINPLTEKQVAEISAIPFENYEIAGSRPDFFLNESILRALTAYYLQKDQKEDMAQILLQNEISQGYIYSNHILELICYYSNNRDKYKNFEEYIPDFLVKLEEHVRARQ